MIRRATEDDLDALTILFMKMALELWPHEASHEAPIYRRELLKHLNEGAIYIDSRRRGFFVVREETDVITPTKRVFNGVRLYIEEEYRGGRLLKQFYDKLFEDFPVGDIYGVTEAHSEHIAVLDKRHELVSNVYKLIRR